MRKGGSLAVALFPCYRRRSIAPRARVSMEKKANAGAFPLTACRRPVRRSQSTQPDLSVRQAPLSPLGSQHPMPPDGGAARQQVEPVALTRPADLPILDSQSERH